MHTYFVDVIKLSILRWADCLEGSLMQSHIFLEEESRRIFNPRRREGNVTTATETGMTRPQAKERQERPEAGSDEESWNLQRS